MKRDPAYPDPFYFSKLSGLCFLLEPVPVSFQGRRLWVHPSDHIEFITWGNPLTTRAISMTDGAYNTELIAATGGGAPAAAKICDNLVAFGYDDWYLPSRYELDAIFKQSYLVRGLDYNTAYWSSTEHSRDEAWYQNFNFGLQAIDKKGVQYRCRCVRKDSE